MWNLTKIIWNHECFGTITQATVNFSKIFNKIHEEVYRKIKNFQNMCIKFKNQSKTYINLLEMTYVYITTDTYTQNEINKNMQVIYLYICI